MCRGDSTKHTFYIFIFPGWG